jgi:[ribosomal protein S5]-alanine N-acetyltransferase
MLEVHFDTHPQIHTARLLLREIIPSDAEALFHIRTHPDVTRYLGRANDKDVSETVNLIHKIRASFEAGDGITWGVYLKDRPEHIIGTMGIWKIDKGNHRGEVGYTLLPEYWRQGLMSEALEAIIHFGFHQIKLHSLEGNTSVDNTASHALLRKFGFQLEAHFKENWYHDGKFSDSMIFSLLTPERP